MKTGSPSYLINIIFVVIYRVPINAQVCDQTLFWLQILESSQTLLHVLKKETGKDKPQPSHSQGSVRDKTGTQTT